MSKLTQISASQLSEPDIKALHKAGKLRLADWWCILNSWRWPRDLPDPEPRDEKERRGAIMKWIEKKIGHDACLERWNDPAR